MTRSGSLWRDAPIWRSLLIGALACTILAMIFPSSTPTTGGTHAASYKPSVPPIPTGLNTAAGGLSPSQAIPATQQQQTQPLRPVAPVQLPLKIAPTREGNGSATVSRGTHGVISRESQTPSGIPPTRPSD